MTDYLDFKADLSDPEVAETFDDFTYWSSMFGHLLFRNLRLAPGLCCLDVGCGTGFPLLELADRVGPKGTIHGIDAWDHAVDRARLKARVRGNSHVHVTHGNAAEMPYDGMTFDLIVSNLGVNNFDQPAVVMAECSRVCKPQGRLALTTNLVGHMSEFYGVFERILSETGISGLVDRLEHQEAHRTTAEELHDLFSTAGFEVTAYHTETFTLHYADGSAFFRSYLSRLGFLEGWRSVLRGTDREAAIFESLEARLNEIAHDNDGLRLSIPAAYIEGQKRLS